MFEHVYEYSNTHDNCDIVDLEIATTTLICKLNVEFVSSRW